MAIVIALLLGGLALIFVLAPIFQKNTAQQEVMKSKQIEEGIDEKEFAARSALQEVELDYQLGNITEEEYRVLRKRYMHRALTSMKERYEQEQQLDDEIEEELRALKEQQT